MHIQLASSFLLVWLGIGALLHGLSLFIPFAIDNRLRGIWWVILGLALAINLTIS